jgi:hypothetical protein
MKLAVVFAIAASAMICAQAPARAAGCAVDPAKASYSIWQKGELKMNVEAIGTHPCGREMSCSGGSIKRRVERICRWL